MNRILVFCLVSAFAACAFGADKVTANCGTVSTGTTAVTSSAIVKGEVAGIRITKSGAATNSVAITLADGAVIYTNAALVSSTSFAPMVPAYKASDGTAISEVHTTGTNVVYVPLALCDQVTVSASNASATGQTLKVDFVIK